MRVSISSGRILAALAGLVALLSVGALTLNVSRQITMLGSASTDNVQWSLSQIEVEFQEYANRVYIGADLAGLRRRFDVFYSRVNTVSQAKVFTDLRADAEFATTLERIRTWLDKTAPLTDGTDVALTSSIPRLTELVQDIRPYVRKLSNSGLKVFAQKADQQRTALSSTLVHLALALAALIGVLALAVIYLVRLNRRVSERENAERETAARMNTVINTSLDGVIVSDADGIIIEFSPTAEKIFGYSAQTIKGRDLGTIIIPDHMRDAHAAGMERMRQNGEKRVVGKGRVQLEGMRADGALFPVELAIQTATTDAGDIFIAFVRDITQQKTDEAELVQARDKAIAGEKSRSNFLATMSHEIRTPLNGLLGNMSLLRDTALNTTQDMFMRNMETSGRLLMSHVSDVLDISRYDSGKITAKMEPMNVSALLQDIVDNQSGMASSHGTTLDWGWDGAPQHWITSDSDRLQHVLMNLIGNAVKFTKRGQVSVTVNWYQDELNIQIEDTGIGIPENLQETIFDDFVMGNTAYDRDVGGTGLGLSIAKRFVDVLGGDITLASETGIGSTFCVTIPATEAQAPETPEKVIAEPSELAARHVLVVEDNQINRFVVRNMLTAKGYIVHEAHDGQQGIDQAAEQMFDLIFMDISMPVLDGRGATRAIREGNGPSARSRIVALTANATPEERADFLANGMDDVLTKPLTKAELYRVLDETRVTTAIAAATLIDAAHADETREVIGTDAFSKLMLRFHAEVDELISWLQSSDTLDNRDIAAQAHKIAGNAAVFGATGLRKALLELEQAAIKNKDDTVVTAIANLPDLWLRSKQALAELPFAVKNTP